MQDASCIISCSTHVFNTTFFKRSSNLWSTCDMSLHETPLSGSNQPCACGSYSPPPPPSPGFAALYFSYMKPQEEDFQIIFFQEHRDMRIPKSWTLPKFKEPSQAARTFPRHVAAAKPSLSKIFGQCNGPRAFQTSLGRATGFLINKPASSSWKFEGKVQSTWKQEHRLGTTIQTAFDEHVLQRWPCIGSIPPWWNWLILDAFIIAHLSVWNKEIAACSFIAPCSSISSQGMLHCATYWGVKFAHQWIEIHYETRCILDMKQVLYLYTYILQ